MIQTERITTEDGRTLIRTYSDAGKMILQEQTGILYNEAVDVEGKYTYTESDQPSDDLLTAEQALSILMGGDGE